MLTCFVLLPTVAFVKRFKKWQRDHDRRNFHQRQRENAKAGKSDNSESERTQMLSHFDESGDAHLYGLSNVSGARNLHTMQDVIEAIKEKQQLQQQQLYRREPKPQVSPISLREACSYIFENSRSSNKSKIVARPKASTEEKDQVVQEQQKEAKQDADANGDPEENSNESASQDTSSALSKGSNIEHFLLIPDAKYAS